MGAPPEPQSSPSSSSDTSPRAAALTSPLNSAGPISLQPSHAHKNPNKRSRLLRRLFRALPIISPGMMCKMPALGGGHGAVTGTRVTGTLFGRRRSRVSLAIQESPGRLPVLVMELAVQTGRIFGEFQAGLVRIALECEKQAPPPGERGREIVEEPLWAMYSNGKRAGYGVRREATEEDLRLMQALRATTMGVGVVPSDPPEPPEGDLVYMRAAFERVVGSKDSETYYMVSPDHEAAGPEVSIFFVRL